MTTQEQIDQWFTFHVPRPGQTERYQAIREAAKHLVEVIVASSASSADQTAAVRKIREAVMTANQAIACEPRGVSSDFAYELAQKAGQ